MKILLCIGDEGAAHIDVNARDMVGKTALHLAAASNNGTVVFTLLTYRGTSVNARDVNAETPLFNSLSSDEHWLQNEVLPTFLNNSRVDVNVKNVTGETIMHKAARLDLTQETNAILRCHNVNPFEQENVNQYSPLHLAIRENSFRVAKILLSTPQFDPNLQDKHSNSYIHILCAVRVNDTRVMVHDETRTGNTKFEQMCEFTKAITSLKCFDVNERNARRDTPLHITAVSNNHVVAKCLLASPSIDVNMCNALNETDRKSVV